MIDLEFKKLTRDLVLAKLSDLAYICRDVPHENWEDNQYLIDLPGKWDLSIVSLSGDNLIGYIIASEKEFSVAHIHKFIVNPSYRGQGIGKKMLDEFIKISGKNNTKITLKVYHDNIDAIRFYQNQGFMKSGIRNNLIVMEMNF